MALFSKLFGGAGKPSVEPEDYQGFAITPTPQKEANGWRIAAEIAKDGRTHTLIRADVLQSKEDAEAASVSKAKQIVDEQGDRMFG